MQFAIDTSSVAGLTAPERAELRRLLDVFTAHNAKNRIKERYYEGAVPLREVNLGIALPDDLAKLEIGCAWGAKCVDVLAGLSQLDGFVAADGGELPEVDELVSKNRLVAEYQKATRDELKFGCTFATLSKDPKAGGAKIRFHSPKTAAARWDGDRGRIASGFAIIDTAPDESEELGWTPTLVYFYTDSAVLALRRTGYFWSAARYPHKMGRPLIEPLVWNATSGKPFGRSRIKEPIRRLIQGYVRTIANASIGLEFATSPQKYLLGVTDAQFEAVTSAKFRQYIGSILASTNNPDTGEKPDFGQLPQGNIAPHVEMIRVLATQFSAASGLSVSDTGVVNDANPTSSDAILAQNKTLVGMAEQLNTGNGDALKTILLMALAIREDKTLEELDERQRDIVARFRNPAMPSLSVTADAAIKIASARKEFAGTDTFLEMLGFSQADIRRINAQEARQRGARVLEGIFSGTETGGPPRAAAPTAGSREGAAEA